MSEAAQDTLSQLEQEHQKFIRALDQIRESAFSIEKRTILESIRNELILHMHHEERVLYAEFLGLVELQEKIPRALDEHLEIQSLILQIEATTDSEAVLALFDKLDQVTRWHFQTEQAIFFPIVRRQMGASAA